MRTGCASISCSLTTQPLPTGRGAGDKEGRKSTLETAVVMTAVTDVSNVFTPGSPGGSTSLRMVLYCTLEGEKRQRNKQKKCF